jgi:hypothetical protein
MDAETAAGHAPVRALRRSCGEQPGKPHDRHRECPAVQEIDDEDATREPDVLDALTRPTV